MYTKKEHEERYNEQLNYINEHFNISSYEPKYLCKTKHDGWECFHWQIDMSNFGIKKTKYHTIDYYTGIGHVYKNSKNPIPPLPFGVLNNLYTDSSATEQAFDDWCGEFGYDTDSRKGLQLYLDCQKSWNDIVKCFPELKNLKDHACITEY